MKIERYKYCIYIYILLQVYMFTFWKMCVEQVRWTVTEPNLRLCAENSNPVNTTAYQLLFILYCFCGSNLIFVDNLNNVTCYSFYLKDNQVVTKLRCSCENVLLFLIVHKVHNSFSDEIVALYLPAASTLINKDTFLYYSLFILLFLDPFVFT